MRGTNQPKFHHRNCLFHRELTLQPLINTLLNVPIFQTSPHHITKHNHIIFHVLHGPFPGHNLENQDPEPINITFLGYFHCLAGELGSHVPQRTLDLAAQNELQRWSPVIAFDGYEVLVPNLPECLNFPLEFLLGLDQARDVELLYSHGTSISKLGLLAILAQKRLSPRGKACSITPGEHDKFPIVGFRAIRMAELIPARKRHGCSRPPHGRSHMKVVENHDAGHEWLNTEPQSDGFPVTAERGMVLKKSPTGSSPSRWLCETLKVMRCVRLVSSFDDGTPPDKEFPETFRTCRLLKFPMEDGISPDSEFIDKSKT
nr:hypothetical protein Iba_chr10cCG3540 [Ipomoea batatas]